MGPLLISLIWISIKFLSERGEPATILFKEASCYHALIIVFLELVASSEALDKNVLMVCYLHYRYLLALKFLTCYLIILFFKKNLNVCINMFYRLLSS